MLVIRRSQINNLFNLHHKTDKMQPSITKFFKTKPPKPAEQDLAEQEPEQIQNSNKRSADDDDDDDVVVKRKVPKPSPWDSPKKGEKKNLEKGDLIENNIETPSKTLPSAQENTKTPSKVMTSAQENIETPSKAVTMAQENIKTPSKLLPLTQETKVVPFASPIMDVSVLIRKKIANGSYALHENIGISWFRALQDEFDKPYFKKLSAFVKQERQNKVVYPPENKVYTWTHHHDIKDTRVIILGQDPYHGPNQAHGLSFSVQDGVRIPPSLVNIYKELESDISGFKAPSRGDLTGWAKQGVLMLNTCLTVNQGQANSHQSKGWETFTDAVISWLSKKSKHKVVFLLWGKPAQRKSSMIDKRHKVLTSAHPSPLSAHNGFFGCRHFSQTNQFIREQSLPEIDWKKL